MKMIYRKLLLILFLIIPIIAFSADLNLGLSIGAHEDVRKPLIFSGSIFPKTMIPFPMEITYSPWEQLSIGLLIKPVFVYEDDNLRLEGKLEIYCNYWLKEAFSGMYLGIIPLALHFAPDGTSDVKLGAGLIQGYSFNFKDRFSLGVEWRPRLYYLGYSRVQGIIDGMIRLGLLF